MTSQARIDERVNEFCERAINYSSMTVGGITVLARSLLTPGLDLTLQPRLLKHNFARYIAPYTVTHEQCLLGSSSHLYGDSYPDPCVLSKGAVQIWIFKPSSTYELSPQGSDTKSVIKSLRSC